MVFSELYSVDMTLEIEDLIQTSSIRDKRMIELLYEVALDNTAISNVNISILKYKAGELSEKDLLIAINKYRTCRRSIIE